MGISIIIPNYAEEKNLIKCIEHINNQNFNKKNIEVIIAEGKRKFKKIKSKYSFQIKQKYLGYPKNQEARKYSAIKFCKFHILCFLDSDNFLIKENFFKIHYEVLKKKNVSFSYCKYYAYQEVRGWLNKYFSAIGGNDPIAYFFDKNDRIPYQCNLRLDNNLKIKNKHKDFTILEYKKINKTIGANGFFIKKKIYSKLKSFDPKFFLHIDTNIKLLNNQKIKNFALVNSEIVHETSGGLFKNLKKRITYFDEFYYNMYNKRNFKIIDINKKVDLFKLIFLIISSFSIIYPLLFSLYKIVTTKKYAWIFHTILINLFILTYTYISLKLIIKNLPLKK
jgi:glycosyltransferase involved in cell wall biosynthesis